MRRLDGTPLMIDLTEARSEAGGVVWERQALPAPRSTAWDRAPTRHSTCAARALRAEVPFLVCTAGYGEYHPGAGTYQFDFTDETRYRIQGPEIDYYFYYGPTPKEIFEEHNLNGLHVRSQWTRCQRPFRKLGDAEGVAAAHRARRDVGRDRADVQPGGVQHGAAGTAGAGAATRLAGGARYRRARWGSADSASSSIPSSAATSPSCRIGAFRSGIPCPSRFPTIREGAFHADEFLLGDEMLVAPIYEPGDRRSVYLPRGNWTNLETNELTQGPRTITVETKSLPVFARNGAIVPLDRAGGMALHYFPKAGGEFFLLEGDIAEYSQVHAVAGAGLHAAGNRVQKGSRLPVGGAPRGDGRPAWGSRIASTAKRRRSRALTDRTWFYDAAQKNVHVRVKVKAGEDCIVNLNFE